VTRQWGPRPASRWPYGTRTRTERPTPRHIYRRQNGVTYRCNSQRSVAVRFGEVPVEGP
jgi:hypothetical protein